MSLPSDKPIGDLSDVAFKCDTNSSTGLQLFDSGDTAAVANGQFGLQHAVLDAHSIYMRGNGSLSTTAKNINDDVLEIDKAKGRCNCHNLPVETPCSSVWKDNDRLLRLQSDDFTAINGKNITGLPKTTNDKITNCVFRRSKGVNVNADSSTGATACQNTDVKEAEHCAATAVSSSDLGWCSGSADAGDGLMTLLVNYMCSCEHKEGHTTDQGSKIMSMATKTIQDAIGMYGDANKKKDGNSEKLFFHFPQSPEVSSIRTAADLKVEVHNAKESNVDNGKAVAQGVVEDPKSCTFDGVTTKSEDTAVGLLDYFKLQTSHLIQKFLVQQQLLFQEIVATMTRRPCVSLQELQLAVKTQHHLIKGQAAQQSRLSRDLEQLMFDLDNLSLSCFLLSSRTSPINTSVADPLCGRENSANAAAPMAAAETCHNIPSNNMPQFEQATDSHEDFESKDFPDCGQVGGKNAFSEPFYSDDLTATTSFAADSVPKKSDPSTQEKPWLTSTTEYLETNGFLPEGRLSRIIAATSHHKPQAKRARKDAETLRPPKRNTTLVESVLDMATHCFAQGENTSGTENNVQRLLPSMEGALDSPPNSGASSTCVFSNPNKNGPRESKIVTLVKENELTCDETLEYSETYFSSSNLLNANDSEDHGK